MSFHANQNNEVGEWRGNGFTLSAHYLMSIDKENLRKLDVRVAVMWWGPEVNVIHLKVKISWVRGVLKDIITVLISECWKWCWKQVFVCSFHKVSGPVFTAVFKLKTECQWTMHVPFYGNFSFQRIQLVWGWISGLTRELLCEKWTTWSLQYLVSPKIGWHFLCPLTVSFSV